MQFGWVGRCKQEAQVSKNAITQDKTTMKEVLLFADTMLFSQGDYSWFE